MQCTMSKIERSASARAMPFLTKSHHAMQHRQKNINNNDSIDDNHDEHFSSNSNDDTGYSSQQSYSSIPASLLALEAEANATKASEESFGRPAALV